MPSLRASWTADSGVKYSSSTDDRLQFGNVKLGLAEPVSGSLLARQLSGRHHDSYGFG